MGSLILSLIMLFKKENVKDQEVQGGAALSSRTFVLIREHKGLLLRIRIARRKSGFLFRGTASLANELPQEVVTSMFDTGSVGI